LKLILREMHF